MISYGQLKESEMYDVDFDHQFIETEKYDAKPTYKKFFSYRPDVGSQYPRQSAPPHVKGCY